MMKRVVLFLSCFFFLYGTHNAYPFGYLTHIHINKTAEPTLGIIFETYGIMPDSFNTDNVSFNNFYDGFSTSMPDTLHSPDPKETPIGSGNCPYQDKQNSGYLLFKAAESNNQINAAKGFGGHIAADWVAHIKIKKL